MLARLVALIIAANQHGATTCVSRGIDHRGIEQRDNRSEHFDPAADVRLNAQGILEWASEKPKLHHEVADYFASRREDD
jgi:hypothetical protein